MKMAKKIHKELLDPVFVHISIVLWNVTCICCLQKLYNIFIFINLLLQLQSKIGAEKS